VVNIATDLTNALPSNSSVNMVQHAIIAEALFSMSSAPRPVLLMDKCTRSLTRDTCVLCGLLHATIEELCFLRCPCRGFIARVHLLLRRVEEFLVEFRGSRVLEQEMARKLHNSDLKC
jgi:hypothetical protein